MELQLTGGEQRIVCFDLETTSFQSGIISIPLTPSALQSLIEKQLNGEYIIDQTTKPSVMATDGKIKILLIVRRKQSSPNKATDIEDVMPPRKAN